MGVTVGDISLAAVLVLGMSGAATAREAGAGAEGTKGHATVLRHGGFAQPAFTATMRVTGKEQPYMWPVSDRYAPVSRPFYGRAY